MKRVGKVEKCVKFQQKIKARLNFLKVIRDFSQQK